MALPGSLAIYRGGLPSEDRNYLWILSRTPRMDTDLYDKLLTRIEGMGYDISRIETTLQPGNE